MKPKILITFRGGEVVNVNTNMDADIVIVDFDVLDQGNSPVSAILAPDSISPGPFYQDFTDEQDPEEVEVRDELKRLKF